MAVRVPNATRAKPQNVMPTESRKIYPWPNAAKAGSSPLFATGKNGLVYRGFRRVEAETTVVVDETVVILLG